MMTCLPQLCLSPAYAISTTGSSAHLGVPHLHTSIPKPVSLPSLTHHCPRPTPPTLAHPRHTFRITVAAVPPLLPKYFSTWPPIVALQPPAATTARATSPLPCIPSPLHRPQILAEGPPTPLPLLASCRFIPEAV